MLDDNSARELQEQIRRIERTAKIGSWEFNLSTNELSWSPGHYEIFEVSKDTPEGRLFEIYTSRVHPGDLEQMREIIEGAKVGQGDFKYDHRVVLDEGRRIKYVQGVGELKQLESGERVLVGTCRDVTEIVLSQKEALEKGAYYQLAIEGANLGAWDWNLEDNTVIFDERWTEMLGLDVKKVEMTLETWESRVHPDDLEDCYADMKRYLDGEVDFYENVHRMKHADGHWVYILDRGRYSAFNDDGKPIRFTGTHLDITKEKVKEIELAESLSFIESLFQSSTDGFLVVDHKTRKVSKVNEAFLKLWRIPKELQRSKDDEKLLGFVVDQLADPGAFVRLVEKLYLEPEANSSDEIEFKDGRVFDRKSFPLMSNGETIARIWSFRDITDEKLKAIILEQERMRSAHQSKLASIGELAAGVGHEINNPLAIAKGYVSSVVRKAKIGKPLESQEVLKLLDKTCIAIERIEKIVSGLKTFSRSDQPEFANFSPEKALVESFNLVKSIYWQDGIEVVLDTETEVSDFEIYGNTGHFQQIVMNLLSNAKDAVSRADQPKIEMKIEKIREQVGITISDNGCGIPDKIKNRIFDPFFSTKGANEGTGLGLALSHNFVKEMNGNIEIHSSASKGTSFLLRFPVAGVAEEAQTVESEAHADFSGLRALIIDDEVDMLDVMSDVLELYGVKSLTASSGQEALRILREENARIDVILSDVKMPGMNGFEVLQSVYEMELSKPPKLILMTGGIGKEDEGLLSDFSNLINGYLGKPASDAEIRRVLSECFPEVLAKSVS